MSLIRLVSRAALVAVAVGSSPLSALAQNTIVVPAPPPDPYGYGQQPVPGQAPPAQPGQPQAPYYAPQQKQPPPQQPVQPYYGQPGQAAQPAYQAQQPYNPYEPQQPPAQQPPYYQQPAPQAPPQQPAAQPAPRYQEADAYAPGQRRPAAANTAQSGDKSLTDRVQERFLYHSKRAAVMSLPSGAALAVGLLAGGIIGGVAGLVAVGAGVGSGAINADFIPAFVIMSLPSVPLGAVVVGSLAYTIARIATVIAVALFYPGEATDFSERIRNMRVYLVADLLGHTMGGLVGFASLGLLSVLGGIASSVIGLLALTAVVQSNAGRSLDQLDPGPQIPISLMLFLFGGLSLSVVPLAMLLHVASAHAGFPLSTLFTRAFIFNDPDTAPAE